MTALQIIERLCSMLDDAQEIIRFQAELLSAHGIDTDDGRMEERRNDLLDRMSDV
ncbi:MAG: hypothetical protein ACI4PG_03820 [Candidatus Ventricola sp.]